VLLVPSFCSNEFLLLESATPLIFLYYDMMVAVGFIGFIGFYGMVPYYPCQTFFFMRAF
jgi:hypothetical protein